MAKGSADDYAEETSILTKISKDYIEDHVYISYVPPPLIRGKGVLARSEYEEWVGRINEIQEDLVWLLELPYHKFWSQFAFDGRVTALLNSYIQNTPRPYELEEFNECLESEIALSTKEAQDRVHALVLCVYIRLASFNEVKESKRLLTASEFGSLIYDKFIFDIPTICDICLIYGSENHLEVSHIVNTVFGQQPMYLNDLNEAVICATKSLKEIMQKSRDLDVSDSALLKGVVCMTPLLDIVNYLIDVVFSVSALLEFYSSACNMLVKYRYVSLLGDIYYNTVPLLYSHAGEISLLVQSGRVDSGKHSKVSRKLRILREEMLKTLNLIVAYFVSESLKFKSENNEDGVKRCIGNFLDVWYDCLPFDTFVRDYNKLYGAQKDFIVLKEVNSSEIESDKISFIMESILSHEILEKKSRHFPQPKNEVEILGAVGDVTEENIENNRVTRISDLELQCRISSVSDILPDVDVDVIRNYLSTMDYSTEKVIDAILKDSIAGIPLDEKKPMESEESYVNQRINVFDGDEFDVMTNDHIDMTRVNLGKKKEKYKDFKELIDDKSHRVEMADMYNRLGVVSEIDTVNGGVDTYDDEYDDTYDDTDVTSRKTFVTPRVLREVVLDSSEDSESEDSEGTSECGLKSNLNFVANPAEIREKMEQKRQAMRGAKAPVVEKDVIGKPKGTGQDQATVINRQRKNANKAGRANHQRKNRSLKKQQQGMF
ncbi:activating signal cointegrator 1 complex subunit 2 [Ischnura elegans]|uniref:activating signal cointegrator 1 complex subunit 2 n=1 Tax=Ischnura elegans TaxID=197161 RepID=UPI001ED89B40|nr:activating signal cointegrator 1 complex subunit 2 [Ischnura elegans]